VKSNFLSKKYQFFSALNFFSQFLVIKTLDSELDPDPKNRKNAGSDLDPDYINADPQPFCVCNVYHQPIEAGQGEEYGVGMFLCTCDSRTGGLINTYFVLFG
jgi:hypothetical protein